MSDVPVVRRQVEILNTLGFHMRPVQQFVRLATSFQSEVKVRNDRGEFNGKSILELMHSMVEQGTRMDVEARGPDAEQAVAALVELVAARFHEPDEPEEAASQGAPPPSRGPSP